MKYDRFDLEQQIMNCWGVCDDLDLLFERSCEYEMTPDELQNALLGMKTLYQMKFEKLFNLFEGCIKQGEI